MKNRAPENTIRMPPTMAWRIATQAKITAKKLQTSPNIVIPTNAKGWNNLYSSVISIIKINMEMLKDYDVV